MKVTNLNDLAREITLMEGLAKKQSIAQIKETLGLLGARWREMGEEVALQEFQCIMDRAGSLSSHRQD